MTEQVEWQPSHDAWRKGATWWDRALPYVEGDGPERHTVYGDWWTEERLSRLSLWQGEAERAMARLMVDDEALERAAVNAVLAARAVRETRDQLAGGWDFATWLRNAQALARPTPDDAPAIAAEVAKRRSVRDAIRAMIVRWVDDHPQGRAARLFPGQASTWSNAQIAVAAGRHSRLLLRLARRALIPDPGDLVPPHLVEQVEARDYTEPATARA